MFYWHEKQISVYFTDRWQKQNNAPVCFGAKSGQFGRFYVKTAFKRVAAVKLVHLYGYVSCDTRHVSYWSYWGCGSYGWRRGEINVVITTSGDQVLLPPHEFIANKSAKWSKVPGYDSFSSELVLSSFSSSHVKYNTNLLECFQTRGASQTVLIIEIKKVKTSKVSFMLCNKSNFHKENKRVTAARWVKFLSFQA